VDRHRGRHLVELNDDDVDPSRQDAIVSPDTIRARAVVNPVTIKIKSNLWIDWTEIAIEHEVAAQAARLDYPEKGGDALHAEKHAGMIAVSASAHALDALYGDLGDIIPLPSALTQAWATKRAKTGKGPPRHARIVETLKIGFALGKAASNWPPRFEELFDRRDAAVHFKEDFHIPVPHPVGANTAASNVTYSLESASSAVDLVLEVLAVCIQTPREQLPTVVKWADDMKSTVDRLVNKRRAN
jgi:hypothetical protein